MGQPAACGHLGRGQQPPGAGLRSGVAAEEVVVVVVEGELFKDPWKDPRKDPVLLPARKLAASL
ncbi:hypothetical protein [Geodermatophilus sp. TF02-6]|uniref:hypothetical protein n=1 Tax=Geodermatophilus sp. TF02-6 TaxID=2250575 RepID=UPI001F215212|nr:hypothetical protein [Geodermatophilus sp. TF02-6]